MKLFRLAALATALVVLSAGSVASCAAPAGITPSTEYGTLDGASFRIDIPPDWNHELVVYYHGYSLTPTVFSASEPLPSMFEPLLSRRYALVQSGYSRTGWAIEQAQAETEKLRERFVARYGLPKRTYVTGMSMGGALTALTIEAKPQIYAGALSLCGVIEPSDRFLQRNFALRAAFDYYFPGLLGPLVPVSADFRMDEVTIDKIAQALAGNPKATRAMLGLYPAANAQNFPPVLAFITHDSQELQQRTGSNPFGNDDIIYVGSGDDAALNDGVRRYRADPKAAMYLGRWYTPSGKLLRPMLALHDTADPLVPASVAFEYALAAARSGHGENFVQQYVKREGHCVFTPEQIGRGFDEIVDWVTAGKRPVAGQLPSG